METSIATQNTLTTDDERWAAVRSRTASADGAFVFAVRTTGVYCRPSCAARAPRRENVRFFRTPAEAETTGFRACKRCRPADADPDAAMRGAVARACARLRDSAADGPPTLAALASAEGFSPFHFQRRFKELVGTTPRRYAAALRAERFRAELTRETTVARAAVEAGYGSAAPAYAEAGAALGMTPGAYRKGAPGVRIAYGIAAVPPHLVLAAETERGVCAIALGDDADGLVRDLAARFPRADLRRDDARVAGTIAAVARILDAPGTAAGPGLALDVGGTPFQRRVWEALGAVPAGETITYTRLAAAAGRPAAVRAAASACAANPVALAIPCHRAVRGDGGLGGYRWGIARKRALLEAERSAGKART